MKKKIVIFISNYLPGYKIGGPLNSIIGITESLKKNFDFYIITSDRDMGDKIPYKGIKTNIWKDYNGIQINYLKADFTYYFKVFRILKMNNFDKIYLNSFFDFKFSIYIILLSKIIHVYKKKTILAPRGELFDISLSFGKIKKGLFIFLARLFKFYRDIKWHSTNQKERESIKSIFQNANIKLAEVLTFSNIEDQLIKKNNSNKLNVIYLSRISKDKNLVYAIRTFKKVKSEIIFHIYGPIEDNYIWDECLLELKKLPKNINFEYKGPVKKEEVRKIFSNYDLFFFPTFSENYGHVINESLSVGTSVLTSNNTPWDKLSEKKLGWDFSLEENELFVNVIEDFAKLSSDDKYQKRTDVLKNYKVYTKRGNLINDYIKLFNGE